MSCFRWLSRICTVSACLAESEAAASNDPLPSIESLVQTVEIPGSIATNEECLAFASAEAQRLLPARDVGPYDDSRWARIRFSLQRGLVRLGACTRDRRTWRECAPIILSAGAPEEWAAGKRAVSDFWAYYFGPVPYEAKRMCPQPLLNANPSTGHWDLPEDFCGPFFDESVCESSLRKSIATVLHIADVDGCLWRQVLPALIAERRQLFQRSLTTKCVQGRVSKAAAALPSDARRPYQPKATLVPKDETDRGSQAEQGSSASVTTRGAGEIARRKASERKVREGDEAAA